MPTHGEFFQYPAMSKEERGKLLAIERRRARLQKRLARKAAKRNR